MYLPGVLRPMEGDVVVMISGTLAKSTLAAFRIAPAAARVARELGFGLVPVAEKEP